MNISHALSSIFGSKPCSFEFRTLVNSNGVTNRVSSHKAGVFLCSVGFSDGTSRSFVGKRKSAVIIANGIRLLCGGSLPLYLRLVLFHKVLGYNGSSVREAVLYSMLPSELQRHLPCCIGSCVTPLTRSCFLALEEFPQSPPAASDLPELVDIITEFHAAFYQDLNAAERLKLNVYTPSDYRRFRYNFRGMLKQLSAENSIAFTQSQLEQLNCFVEDIHHSYSEVMFHRTLTHNDFSVRNISRGERLCVYDWELSCFQNPEHDIVELLISMLGSLSETEALTALSRHRERLSLLTGVTLTDVQYNAVLRFSTLEFCVNKLSILRLAGRKLGLDYTEQLAANASAFMKLINII